MGGKTSKTNTTLPQVSGTITTASSNTIHSRRSIAQSSVLIWMNANIEETKENRQNTLTQLQNIANNVKTFTQWDPCIDFLTEIDDMKAFMIVDDTIDQQIVPLIHDIPHLHSIYIYCRNKSAHDQWAKQWAKIKCVHTEIKSICVSVQQNMKQWSEDAISISFVAVGEDTSKQNLNQLEPTFMYTQIFKEILLGMEYDQQSIKSLADYWRTLYDGNTRQLNIIDEFEHDYRPQLSIWWYTREYFTYQMLNRALREMECSILITMGFFLRDVQQQIEELHKKQVSHYYEKPFLVYRGQGLSNINFEKLMKTKGGLISFNNFLSTSKDQDVPLAFAESVLNEINTVGIFFQISINPSIKSVPFASIQEVSYFKTEEEILFSMHSVFRITEVRQMDNNKQLYQVNLTLTSDDDQQLRILTDRIRKEAGSGPGWKRLARLLVKIGQFNKAEELYYVLLGQTSDDSYKSVYYNQLGLIKEAQGEYEKANLYHEKAIGMYQKTFPTNNPLVATSYNNIGLVRMKKGEYSKALVFYEKALEIDKKNSLPRQSFVGYFLQQHRWRV